MYVGEFEAGYRHGRGVYTRADGSVEHDGRWTDGMAFGAGKWNGFLVIRQCSQSVRPSVSQPAC